jgi:phosphate transport system substrate-binding protein
LRLSLAAFSSHNEQRVLGLAKIIVFAMLLAMAVSAAACGGSESDTAAVVVDGSSTLGPFTARAAHEFQLREPGIDVDVGISRTSQGFDRFCAGELDIANASRKIDEDEAAACAEEGIEYVELQVANDAITIAIHKPILYDWVTCLNVDQLREIWEPDSDVTNWNQVDSSFPDVPLRLYGADEGSGTFGYFTFVINGERGASRTDYSATDDDNDTVEGVADDKGALGYFGFSYYQANRNRLNALAVDGGNGCVAPSVETVQRGTYEPLSRPLYIYVRERRLGESPPLRQFVRYILENQASIAENALFVPLSKQQLERQLARLADATA